MDGKDQAITLTRDALYRKIWSTPTRTLAKEFGITDTGLAKICKRMRIPLPPRGYWNKLQAGKPVISFRLPPALPETQLDVTIHPTSPKPPPVPARVLPRSVEVEISSASAKLRPVSVPANLAHAHPLIRRWIDEDRKEERESRRRGWPATYDVIDGSEIKKRRLTILSAIFKEWERLGHKVKTEGYGQLRAYLEIDGHKIEFVLFEYEQQRRRPLTNEEKYDSLYQHNKWRQIKEPTGQLIFRIKSHIGFGAQKEWRDNDDRTLEQQINGILNCLVAVPALLKEEETRRREVEQKNWEKQKERAEQDRLGRVEAARWRHLLDMASGADQARTVRSFLEGLEARLEVAECSGSSKEDREWLQWARAKADRMDPLTHRLDGLVQENRSVNEWTYK